MLPYFIPPFLALLGAIYNRRLTANSLKLLYWLTTLSALFFYCCVYMNGADWPEYEMIYNELTWENLFQIASDRKFEIGFCFLMLLFKAIGFGFFPFLIIAKSFSLIVISNFFKSYAINYGRGYSSNVFFLLLIFYLGSCMYLYVETIIRFSLALAIVVFAYKYLLNKRFFLFLFWLLIAITFHKSAILLLPIYFINNITFSNKWLVIIFGCIITLLSPQILLTGIEQVGKFIPQIYYVYLRGYLEVAVITGTDILSIGNIIHMFFLCLCLIYRKQFISQTNYGEKLFAYMIIYFLLYFVTVYAGSIGRISLYLRPFFIIVFASVLFFNRYYKPIMVGFVILYLTLGMRNVIIEKKSFLPYTNYITSVLSGENLSFDERTQIPNKDK